MATKELVKSEAGLSAERTFCNAIPIEGKFNVSIGGTWVCTLSLQRKFKSDTDIASVATSTTANKLVDTSQNFTTNGVRVGDWVHNTTDNTHAQITAIDGATTLSINGNIMASGEEYIIQRWWDLPTSGDFTSNSDKRLEEIEGGVQYRIGIKGGNYVSGTAYVRLSK